MSYLGLLLYAGVFWTLKFSFYSPAYVDHVSQAMLLAALYATVSRRYLVAAAILGVSAFQKEFLPLFGLFVAADWLHHDRERRSLRTVLGAALAIGLPILALFVVQRACGIDAGASLQVIGRQVRRLSQPGFPAAFLHAMFSGLGILPVLMLVRYRPWLRVIRERPAFVVYLALATVALFGGADKSRLFNYSLPVIVIFAMATIESLRPASDRRFLVWAVVCLGVHWYLGNYVTPVGGFREYIAKLVPEHAAKLKLDHLPYLIRDGWLSALAFVFTVQCLIGTWRFRWAVGFAGRETRVASSPGN